MNIRKIVVLTAVLALAAGGRAEDKSKQKPKPKPAAAAPAPAATPTPASAGGNLGSMEVTGQAKDKLTIEKRSPEIKLDVADMVDSLTDKTEKLLEKGRPVPAPEDFQRFDKLGSNQAARPWLPEFAEPPLISFLPSPSKTTVSGWRLEVTDERGDTIQTLTGSGNPVKEIIWDGLDKNGAIIKVAAAYSFRFVTVDEFKNAHTTMGKAFTLKHLKYPDKKSLIMEISSGLLFKDDKLAPEGLPIFERALDVLREYSLYPFVVEFHTENPKGDQVRARSRAVTEKIAGEMLIPPDGIKSVFQDIKDRGDVMRFVIRLK